MYIYIYIYHTHVYADLTREKLIRVLYFVHVNLSCVQLVSKIFITYFANVPFQHLMKTSPLLIL